MRFVGLRTTITDQLTFRMQLQGELTAKGDTKKIYTGLFQGLGTIAKHEGITACQRGLLAAVSMVKTSEK